MKTLRHLIPLMLLASCNTAPQDFPFDSDIHEQRTRQSDSVENEKAGLNLILDSEEMEEEIQEGYILTK